MILRSLALRSGRRALAKPPVRSWKRCLATEVESINDQVEGGVGGSKSEAVLNSQVDASRSEHASNQVAEDFFNFEVHKRNTGKVGSRVAPYYQPHQLLDRPPKPSDINLELLLASQAHLGHATGLWNPANARYIYGIREGIHIISLDVTASHLRRACTVVRAVTERGGLILFVGTREGQKRAVVKAAQLAEGCHLFDKWIPGSITNGIQILGRCQKKVVDVHDNDVPGFEDQIAEMGSLKPDLVVCLNPLDNYVLLHECGLHNIPTIGVIDTDANPTWVTYPIPANDDSLRCINVIAGVLGRAAEEGQAARRALLEQGISLYRSPHNLSELPPPEENEPAQDEEDETGEEGKEDDEEEGEEGEGEEEDEEEAVGRPSTSVDAMNADKDTAMLHVFHLADFTDFDPQVMQLAEQIAEDEGVVPPSDKEGIDKFRSQMRRERKAAGQDPETGLRPGEDLPIDADAEREFEEETERFLNSRLTGQELDEFYSKNNLPRFNQREHMSVREALEMSRGAEDPLLKTLIAHKRQKLGEQLSDEDKAVLGMPVK